MKLTIKPMIYKEAREVADKINANMNNVRVLVIELYNREGWLALGYENWTECVQKEFKQAERYIFYQQRAAQIEQNVTDCTVVQLGVIPERQLRPLARLEPDQQRIAWTKAVETAPEGKVTAAHVSKVVKEMTGQQTPPKPQKQPEPPMPQKPEYAAYFVSLAISQLERIPDNDPAIEEEFNRLREWITNKLKKGKK